MTYKEQISKMIGEIEEKMPYYEVLKNYKQFIYENDEELKGNAEAKKELNASIMQIDHAEKMLEWLNKELIRQG